MRWRSVFFLILGVHAYSNKEPTAKWVAKWVAKKQKQTNKRIKLIFLREKNKRMIQLNICAYKDSVHKLQSFSQKYKAEYQSPIQKLI